MNKIEIITTIYSILIITLIILKEIKYAFKIIKNFSKEKTDEKNFTKLYLIMLLPIINIGILGIIPIIIKKLFEIILK